MSYAFVECEKKRGIPSTSVEEVFDEVHIKLPLFSDKKSEKYGKKINKILKRYQVNNVVLSNELLKNEVIKNMIFMQNHDIITGEYLYRALINKSIKDICSVAGIPHQMMKVVIFVHVFSIENLDLVKYIAKDVKQLTVISNNMGRFERITEELLEKDGIIITYFDETFKGTLNCNFAINVDFLEEELKRYLIQKNTIIFSIKENMKELRKSFNGVLINQIDVYSGEEDFGFLSLAICEARMYDYRRSLKDNEIKMNKLGYKVNAYVGNNGNISEEEIKRLFTKNSKNNA